ncbi:MAG: cysteine--tRNA ligase [Actinomycetota bacterium]|nr:cysteine--tRNA ligase [Actinomycetota bacterium]
MGNLVVFNTLSKKKEEFIPAQKDKVKMYVCGPTVYNYISIGNGRPIVVFDMVKNYLEYRGYKVEFVQNITDIEDKIINKANQEKVSYKEITQRYIEAFLEDLDNLKVGPFTHMPLATNMIDQIIKTIQAIIDNGYGYVVDGNVYFEVAKFPSYGKLSGQKIEEMKSQDDNAELGKKNKVDFALWKKAKPGEPSWPSPWGEGRPGWHIECSAMSTDLLGSSIDIHGGGLDLVFPHHENEIAQSEAANPGQGQFVKYWLHNGMIEVKDEKMSKSSGLKENWILKNLLKKYNHNVIKMYILSTHYRSPLEFSEEKLQEATKAVSRITNTLRNIRFLMEEKTPVPGQKDDYDNFQKMADKAVLEFRSSMDDDFNSAKAIGDVFEMIKKVNSLIQDTNFKNSEWSIKGLELVYGLILELMQILGFDFMHEVEHPEKKSKISQQEIEDYIAHRNKARADKDFAKADQIREELEKRGVVLEDRKEGTIYRYEHGE